VLRRKARRLLYGPSPIAGLYAEFMAIQAARTASAFQAMAGVFRRVWNQWLETLPPEKRDEITKAGEPTFIIGEPGNANYASARLLSRERYEHRSPDAYLQGAIVPSVPVVPGGPIPVQCGSDSEKCQGTSTAAV
jgi:hypothetical protein